MPKTLLEATEDLVAKRKPSGKLKTIEPPWQLMLPLWPDSVRAVPNAIVRGSLFNICQRRKTLTKYTKLASVEGLELSFKGETFNQTDLDTLEMILHLAREQPINAPLIFTSHALLKELNRGTGQTQYNQLIEQLERLNDSSIRFSVPGEVMGNSDVKREVFYGKMLADYKRRERHDGTHEHMVYFNEKVLSLYGLGYSYIDWKQRQALNSSLAKYLHGLYASHAAPYAYKVETIRSLCGSTVERLSDFRKQLRTALDELKAVRAIIDWEITDSDLVKINKTATRSQLRHLRNRLK